MTTIPLVITTACYLWTAFGFATASPAQPAMATIFVFYACANAGFLAIAAGWK